MIKQVNIIHRIDSEVTTILSSDGLTPAIHQHYESFKAMYSADPGLYKILLKKSRFIPSVMIIVHAYCEEKHLISDIIKKCLMINMMNVNSLYSLVDFLYLHNIIKKSPSSEDKRKQHYAVTEKGESGIVKMITTMASALYQLKNRDVSVDDNGGVTGFLGRYNNIIDSGLLFFHDVGEVDVFINKNGGHFILLYLYCNHQNNEFNGSVAKLSAYCHVSRTHIARIISEAIHQGLLAKNSQGKIILLPEFIAMTEKYMARQFSFVMYGLGYL
ncbi:MarR family winged helix-turn-helix transcriptional regulator [Enterobacteriaceae bacterium ESL0689]|nr:MarR family winged helix-turn-helix transcriptional regulator [Enterobacteriaceae bacterium ESL0689]